MNTAMKRLTFTLLIPLISLLMTAQSASAEDIVAKADANLRGNSSHSQMTMTIVRPTYRRSISMRSWTKGSKLALIKLTAPAKDKGQGFLKVRKEMWNWIPTIDRMVKMSSSVMGQSWMGSDFTNDDMVRESSIVEDYTPRILGTESIRGYECYKIELTPNPNAAVVWSKVISWIDKKRHLIIRSENFDEEMQLAQTSENYEFKTFGKRTTATRMEIIPADKKGHSTIVTIDKAEYDTPINDNFFSQQNLKNIQ